MAENNKRAAEVRVKVAEYMLNMVGQQVGDLQRSTKFDADVRAIRSSIEILDQAIKEVETKDLGSSQKLRKDYQSLIENLSYEIKLSQVRQDALLLNDIQHAEALPNHNDESYLSLSADLGPKLIAASVAFIKAKAVAALLFSSYQYDDLKVKGTMDDLAKAFSSYKGLVLELQALKPSSQEKKAQHQKEIGIQTKALGEYEDDITKLT